MNVQEYNELLEKARKLPSARIYRNSKPVVTVDGVALNAWGVVKAAVKANHNVLLLGERGEGKTQIQKEVGSLMDGNITYVRLDDSFREEDIFIGLDLARLRSGEGTTLDAKKVAGKVDNPCTVIDELTNAHPKVQNRTFGIWDREVQDRKGGSVRLGREFLPETSYHITIGAANVGSERYFSASVISPPILDRAHIILNIDNYTPNSVDLAAIFLEAKTPTAVTINDGDLTDVILEIARDIKNVGVAIDARIAQVYLKAGIDYCVRADNKSKLAVVPALPRICEGCHYLGDGCGYTLPISTRTGIVVGDLAAAIKVTADAESGFEAEKLQDTRVGYEHILAAFELAAPYSGILDQNWLDEQYKGSPHFAMTDIIKKIRKEITGKQEAIGNAFGEAISGKLTEKSLRPFEHRWAWFRGILESMNAAASKYGALADDEKDGYKAPALERVAREYPIVQWLR